MGRMFKSICLFVRSITQKQKIPKCSNLVWGMTLVYPRNNMVFGLKGQGHRVNKCIFHTNVHCPEHNSKTNDPKVFKFGMGIDLGIS